MVTNSDASKVVFGPQQVGRLAVNVIEERSANPNIGIKTGIDVVDNVLNPHRPGELRVVLGYTSNYKSGLMNFIARHNANVIKQNGELDSKCVITITWEQSVEEQGITDLGQLSCIDMTKMMRGELDEVEWKKLKKAAVERGVLPWWLIGHSSESKERRPRLTMTQVWHALEYIIDVQKITPQLVVMDYLQRIEREKGDTMREQYMQIVDRCKDLALALHVPVMLGSQAGRQVKGTRQWRLPQVDDGQETSNLEQSADSFISTWMPKNDYPAGQVIEYGDKTYTVTPNLLVLGVMKQKFGQAPKLFQLHVTPETNQIYPVTNQYQV
jgi:replicative DNA helicase